MVSGDCAGGELAEFARDPGEIEAVCVSFVEEVCRHGRGDGRGALGGIESACAVKVVDGRTG